jgi:hypothetical protein
MKLCYLINQYPKVSHSFIRRERTIDTSGSAAQLLNAFTCAAAIK